MNLLKKSNVCHEHHLLLVPVLVKRTQQRTVCGVLLSKIGPKWTNLWTQHTSWSQLPHLKLCIWCWVTSNERKQMEPNWSTDYLDGLLTTVKQTQMQFFCPFGQKARKDVTLGWIRVQVTIMNRACCCNSIRLFEIANVGARMVGQCESHSNVPAYFSDVKSSLSCSLWTACKGKASVIQWGQISLSVVKFQRILSLWLRRMK